MQLEKVRHATKARAAIGSGPLTRFIVVLFASTIATHGNINVVTNLVDTGDARPAV